MRARSPRAFLFSFRVHHRPLFSSTIIRDRNILPPLPFPHSLQDRKQRQHRTPTNYFLRRKREGGNSSASRRARFLLAITFQFEAPHPVLIQTAGRIIVARHKCNNSIYGEAKNTGKKRQNEKGMRERDDLSGCGLFVGTQVARSLVHRFKAEDGPWWIGRFSGQQDRTNER